MSVKDEILLHDLPPSLQINLAVKSSQLMRSYSDMKTPLNELMRMVKSYSQPWSLKAEALKRVHAQYEEKKRMLNIALRKLQLTDIQSQRMAEQLILNNWEKLYSRVVARRGHGRRWKFRMKMFESKANEGYEALQSYLNAIDRGSTDIEISAADQFQLAKEPTEVADDVDDNMRSTSESKDSDDDSDSGTDEQETVVLSAAKGPVEVTSSSQWTHEDRVDRYFCVRVARIEGAAIAKRHTLTLQVSINNKTHTFPTDVLRKVLDKERSSSGKSAAVSNTDTEENPTSGPLDALEFPMEESLQNELINAGDKALGTLSFKLLEEGSSVDDAFSVTEISLESIVDMIPPTVDLQDYFGEGDDESEFLLEEDPMKLPLVTRKGSIPVGSLHYYLYFGLRVRPFITEKFTETGLTLLDDLIAHALDIDMTYITKDDIHRGLNLLKRHFEDQSTSPLILEESRAETRETVVSSLSGIDETEENQEAEKEPVITQTELQEALDTQKAEFDETISQYEGRVDDLNLTIKELETQLTEYRKHLEELKSQEPKVVYVPQPLSSTEKVPGPERSDLETKSKFTPIHRTYSGEFQKQSTFDSYSTQAPIKEEASLTTESKPQSADGKKFRQVNYRLPNWTAGVKQNFLDRLIQYENDKTFNRNQLDDKIKTEIAANIERNLEGQHKLGFETSALDPSLPEVCLPALFMPTRQGTVFNPRSNKSLHPLGAVSRLTQPPSIFQLPPIPGMSEEYSLIDILAKPPNLPENELAAATQSENVKHELMRRAKIPMYPTDTSTSVDPAK